MMVNLFEKESITEPTWRQLVFRSLNSLGQANYRDTFNHFHNSDVSLFFMRLAKLNEDPKEEQIRAENMTEEEQLIISSCLVNFAHYFTHMGDMHLMISESDCLKGMKHFRVDLLPFLVQLVSVEVDWKDFAISLISWEERCKFFMANGSSHSQVLFQCVVHPVIINSREVEITGKAPSKWIFAFTEASLKNTCSKIKIYKTDLKLRLPSMISFFSLSVHIDQSINLRCP
ncbi:hypothetical protein PENTCL1PPCAC_7639 [Pristionchus entomophagus]|uniref:Uncharacterized protein n=1 Tax=Pristionchus entomophagus TaxID=358040 RepID=A0AAV5SYV7_9BILA|nr:hypothetical protein PENTCL1PPCAC_7639 [Pristionchus entomophagus]